LSPKLHPFWRLVPPVYTCPVFPCETLTGFYCELSGAALNADKKEGSCSIQLPYQSTGLTDKQAYPGSAGSPSLIYNPKCKVMGIWVKLIPPGEAPGYAAYFEMYNPSKNHYARLILAADPHPPPVMDAHFAYKNGLFDATVPLPLMSFDTWYWVEILMDALGDKVELWIDGVLKATVTGGWEGFGANMYSRIFREGNRWFALIRFDYWRMHESLEYPPT
jgi:hypothetical protein